MGKEQSKGKMPQLEGDAIEVTDSYVLRSGRLPSETACSVFSGSSSTPLLTLANNLKTHRHPNIVKYISSEHREGRLFIVTEEVQPLFIVLGQLTPLEVCVGLNSIVTALQFLHQQAKSSHNNVCCASIFTTSDGTWKLGGLEFMTKFENTTSSTLRDFSPRRYEPAVTPEEKNGRVHPEAIDVFGLGTLMTELLSQHASAEFPHLQEMLQMTSARLLDADPRARPTLAEIANHSFFCHDFIKIYRFLAELPLKGSEEKTEFFRELGQHLRHLPEELVGSQLVPLMLARIVVLEPAAQQHLLPILLRPKSDTEGDCAVFSETSFKRYVVPKLLQMFCVRDTSVRMLLLTYLQAFIGCFTRNQLQAQVLPELLVGVKDCNDTLVAATLNALSTLVTALGGAAVVGGHRARLFSDGLPATRRPRTIAAAVLPERPSPDGGEDSVAEDTEAWSDWEQPSEKAENEVIAESTSVLPIKEPIKSPALPAKEIPVTTTPATLSDIDALDIKNPGGWRFNSGPDFFSDMEPVISKTQVAPVIQENKFQVADLEPTGDAWESFEDWGEATT